MKKAILILPILFIAMTVQGQRYTWDVGGKIGLSNLLGDIGGDENTRRDFIWDFRWPQTGISIGGFARYKVNNLISVNGGVNWYHLEGDDAISSNPGRRGRNLSFKNDLLDLTFRGEVYVYNINDVGNRGRYRMDFKSFLFAGVSGIYSNPKARNPDYNGGAWTALQPLTTEGQIKPYSKFTFGVPVGIGVYFTYRRQHRFGWELGTTITFTDYLDDISGTYPEIDAVGHDVYYAFTNRSHELSPDELPEGGVAHYEPGEKRGGADENDSFVYSHFTYSYVLRGKNGSFYTQKFGWLSGRKRGGRRKVRAKF